MNNYGWIDQLINQVREQAPERTEQEQERMERWISDQVERLWRERDIK